MKVVNSIANAIGSTAGMAEEAAERGRQEIIPKSMEFVGLCFDNVNIPLHTSKLSQIAMQPVEVERAEFEAKKELLKLKAEMAEFEASLKNAGKAKK